MSLYKKNYWMKTVVGVNKSMKRQDYDAMLKNGKRKTENGKRKTENRRNWYFVFYFIL